MGCRVCGESEDSCPRQHQHPGQESYGFLRASIRCKVYGEPEDPAKVILKESKSSHGTIRGNPLIIDIDDIHTNKPNAQEMEPEDLIYLPTSQQPSATTSLGLSTQE